MPVVVLALAGLFAVLVYQRVHQAQPAATVSDTTSSTDDEPIGTYVMDNSNQPRGIRNNNPGNLRPGSPWLGLANPSVDAGGYLRFTTAAYGLRALAINLLNQQSLYSLRTVRAIITKYAPTSENNTAAYIAAVSNALGVTPDTTIDLLHNLSMFKLFVAAIVQHENGQQPYTDAQLSSAVSAAITR